MCLTSESTLFKANTVRRLYLVVREVYEDDALNDNATERTAIFGDYFSVFKNDSLSDFNFFIFIIHGISFLEEIIGGN